MRAALLALVLLTGCGVHTRVEQRWIGRLDPTTDRPECVPTQGTLTVRDGIVTFAPDEGTWVLTGRADADHLTATRDHPTPDHKTYHTSLDATRTPAQVTGTYTTPICTYRVALRPLG